MIDKNTTDKQTTLILLFLDIDGVLNNHRMTQSGYNTIDENKCTCLNYVLRAYPNLKIVISSAWRYMILDGNMTLKGFEYMLLKSGLCCNGRVIGCTERDPHDGIAHDDAERWSQMGLKHRVDQIQTYLEDSGNPPYVVLDDLRLKIPNFIQTFPNTGLDLTHIDRIIEVIESQL